jgi:acyl-coenzyme A synthetase/AMP-(fatty) acid ligase
VITELIFDWAQKTPNKPALIYNEQTWSYGSLAEEIALARAYFSRRGCVGPGYAVLAFQNLLDFWIFSLALRSLGLTTVAVGNTATIADLALRDVRCVIARPSEPWPDLAPLCAARGWKLLSVSLKDEPAPDNGSDDVGREAGGHILLTSGTTGTYKMVLMSPAIDSFLLRRKADYFGLNADSVVTVFDFAARTAIGYRCAAVAWIAGGATLIEQGREPYRALRHTGLTHAILSPGRLDVMLRAPANAFPRNERMQLIVGGGAMTRRQIEQTKARITPRLFNCFASTEASIIGHTYQETEEDQRWHWSATDRPVEIVDEADRPVAPGEIGRVRVSTGKGPAGYLDNEAVTKAFFRNGYFYPGDLAIMRSDGRFALQGRSTDVINLQGQKIFPGPVEDRLRDLLDVRGVCLLSMQNSHGEEELYVAIEASRPLEDERLYAALNSALRAYPRAHIRVRYVPSLPRNQMGKIMRQTVREHMSAGLATAS